MIDNTWKLKLPLTAVRFSKQNSTFVAEFNSNLKISRGAQPPLPLPLLRACKAVRENKKTTNGSGRANNKNGKISATKKPIP